jgi:hypothetical protein
MSGAIPPLPQYAFMAWCLVKSTGATLPFTFYFQLFPYVYISFRFVSFIAQPSISGYLNEEFNFSHLFNVLISMSHDHKVGLVL